MLKPLNKVNTVLLSVNIVMVTIFLAQNAECGLSGGVTGTYSVQQQFIKAKAEGRTPQEVLGTCAHEVGHHVWYEYLSEAERAQYESIYNDSTEWVSSYARIGGLEEDFAESFEAAVTCSFNTAPVPLNRRAFFDEHVSPVWSEETMHVEDQRR